MALDILNIYNTGFLPVDRKYSLSTLLLLILPMTPSSTAVSTPLGPVGSSVEFDDRHARNPKRALIM